MSAPQERQATLDSVAPRFLAGDMEQALAFYGQLGFATTSRDGEFAIVERDEISLYFTVSIGHSVCLIGVTKSEGCISSMCRLVLFGLLSLSRRRPSTTLLDVW